MEHRLVFIAIGVALSGTVAGFTLGGYATGGQASREPQGSWWSSGASAEESIALPQPAAIAAADGPKGYVCKGCGPTLAERRMESYMTDYAPPDPSFVEEVEEPPLPTFRSSVYEGETRIDLPDIAALGY